MGLFEVTGIWMLAIGKTIMHSITIKVESFDKDEFLKKATAEFDLQVAKYTADMDTIGSAVNAVFDRYPGVRLNSGSLRTYVLTDLKAEPATYQMLLERLELFIKENKGEKGKALLGTSKGKNGGIWRWSDVVETPAAK